MKTLIKKGYIDMNCDKCLHKGVCKNEEAARAWENKFNINELKHDQEKPEEVDIFIDCKNFEMKFKEKNKKKQPKE